MLFRISVQRGLSPFTPGTLWARGAAAAAPAKKGGKEVKKATYAVDVISNDPFYTPKALHPIPDMMKPSENYPSKTKVDPQRDLVNFPNVKIADSVPPTSLGFIPRSYLEFFYPKTGVSGPWVFVGALSTFLISKEFYVIEHEFWNGTSLVLVLYMLHRSFGPAIKAWAAEKTRLEEEQADDLQLGSIANLEESVENEKTLQWQAQGQKMLFQAKRENVAMQLESAFRERQMTVYKETKKRLDYQVEVQNAEGRIKHGHMVNWIVNNVNKALTPELEKTALKQCIADLKGLAAKA